MLIRKKKVEGYNWVDFKKYNVIITNLLHNVFARLVVLQLKKPENGWKH